MSTSRPTALFTSPWPACIRLAALGLASLLAAPLPAQVTIDAWKSEISPVATQLFGVAYDEDLQVFHIVGDQGVVLMRYAAPSGLGTWTQQTTDVIGMQPQLLDVVCRAGVGCAASGIDMVLVNTTGSWETLVDTRGSSLVYGPVWLLDDAVIYGQLSFPLNFLWRRPLSGDPGLGISVGNQPVTSFCERMGELVTIDADGNVIGYPFDLDANQAVQYVGPVALGLSTAGLVDDGCATTPGGEGSDASPGSPPGALGIVQPSGTTWRPKLLHNGVWQPDGPNQTGLVLAVIQVTPKNLSGFLESFGVGTDTTSTFAGYWDFLSSGEVFDFGGPTSPESVGMTSYYQVASAADALGAGIGLEVLVGDVGLITVRSFSMPIPPPPEIFDDGFETGDLSMWSLVSP